METAFVFGKINNKEAVESLLELLNDKNELIRVKVIEVLGELGDKRAIKPLLELLEDKNERVKQTAIKALGILKDESFDSTWDIYFSN